MQVLAPNVAATRQQDKQHTHKLTKLANNSQLASFGPAKMETLDSIAVHKNINANRCQQPAVIEKRVPKGTSAIAYSDQFNSLVRLL